MQEKQRYLFESESTGKAIATMAVPAMATMLVMILYNMADMFFVGQLGDNAQVAAVSLVGPVFNIMMAIGSMLGGGGCALIAKTLGEQDAANVRLYSSLCAWSSVVLGGAFGAGLLLLRGPLLGLLGANAEIEPYARTYLSFLALGAPVMVFTAAMGNILRAEGAVKQSMVGNLLSTVTNMVLDPLFILVLPFGVAGAAVATVLGNVVGAAYLIGYLRKYPTSLSLSYKDALQNPVALLKIISIGLPNLASSTLVGFANGFANRLLVQYGTVAVAAMAAAGKSTMVISMLQMGFTMGVQPLMGYSYGARNLPRLKKIITQTALLTIGMGTALSVSCFFGSRVVVALFLKDASALALGQQMIRLLVLSGPFLGLYYISSSFLQASGNAPTATFTSLLRQGIFFVPLVFVMNAKFGVTGNICAHLTADILAALVAGTLAVRQYQKLKNALVKQV